MCLPLLSFLEILKSVAVTVVSCQGVKRYVTQLEKLARLTVHCVYIHTLTYYLILNQYFDISETVS